MEKADEIKKQVKEILIFCLSKDNILKRRDNIDEYKQECMRNFPNFHMNYPTLFFSIIENPTTFPIYRLEEMLSLKSKIENNELDDKKASVHMGQKYYDEFVKKTVDKLDKDIKNK
jgi:hypothetical protein